MMSVRLAPSGATAGDKAKEFGPLTAYMTPGTALGAVRAVVTAALVGAQQPPGQIRPRRAVPIPTVAQKISANTSPLELVGRSSGDAREVRGASTSAIRRRWRRRHASRRGMDDQRQ